MCVRDFAKGALRSAFSYCAMCTLSKANHPFADYRQDEESERLSQEYINQLLAEEKKTYSGPPPERCHTRSQRQRRRCTHSPVMGTTETTPLSSPNGLTKSAASGTDVRRWVDLIFLFFLRAYLIFARIQLSFECPSINLAIATYAQCTATQVTPIRHPGLWVR